VRHQGGRGRLWLPVACLAIAGLIAAGAVRADGPPDPPRALGYPAPIQTAPAPPLGTRAPRPLAPQQQTPPQPQQPQPQQPPAQQPQPPEAPNTQMLEGTGEFVAGPSPDEGRHQTQSGDVTLDFADADIRDVVRSVLGEMLKVPYVVDPQVSGHLTLKTGAPISQDSVLPVLETALKTVGAAIVVANGMYSVVPVTAAQKQAAQVTTLSGESGTAGYGIEVVPLKFISADEMQKVLEPLAPQGAVLRIDPQRNLIFLAGTEPERASIRNTIALFDVDYLKGMSFALIQPQHVDAGTLATELEKIFDETSSPIAGMVRIIPIGRINTLLVVTARASYLHEVSRWVARLDVIPVTPGRQLHYYRLQNARAADIAQTLNEIFGTASPATRAAAPGAATNGPPPTMAAPPSPGGAMSMPPPLPAPLGVQGASAPFDNPMMRGPGAGASADAPQIVTDDNNNALIIRADAAEYDAIDKIIRQMDVTPDQVMIEATIVEVTLNDNLKYGVEWAFKNGSQTFTQAATGIPTTSFPGFGYTYNVPNISIAMSALGTLSKINVVSSPRLLTLDNMPATLEVGDQVPIITQTSTSAESSGAPVIATVQQRDTGVLLSVTPRIGSSGMVYLTISQEVSDVVPTTTSNIDSPTIQQRKVQATVAVSDGNTVALGGMMRRSETSGNSGVPYFKDIPVIGGLFGAQSNNRERTELLIFLTPRVVRSPPAALAVTEDLRRALDGVRETMEHFANRKKDIPRLPWR
jgi:general secretion pathway protein D